MAAKKRKRLFYNFIWTIIMAAGAYFAIMTFDSMWALVVGYAISFVQIIRSGKIE